MAINLQQFLAKQLSDGVIDQQLCDLLNAVAFRPWQGCTADLLAVL